MISETKTQKNVRIAYIGCWFNRDMYSHNCSNMVDSLRATAVDVDVVTSNCRCFSSAQRFGIPQQELVNSNCSAIVLPHAPHNPGRNHGLLKYLIVKTTRIDLLLDAIRGFLYYRRTRHADIIHFDQVLEAFGCVPLYVLLIFARLAKKTVTVAVHEIDPLQRNHAFLNRMYGSCAEIFVFSLDMQQQLVGLGIDPAKIKVIRYGAMIPALTYAARTQYVYFGGHNILRGKGYPELLQALAMLRSQEKRIRVLIYVGYGCNGLEEAKRMAQQRELSDIIEWQDLYSEQQLAAVYQQSKACIVPYTSGSARHALSCALANATPVIATRAIDIPEYLGDLGMYVDGSPESVVSVINKIEDGIIDRDALGRSLREKATKELDQQKLAAVLSEEYRRIKQKCAM